MSILQALELLNLVEAPIVKTPMHYANIDASGKLVGVSLTPNDELCVKLETDLASKFLSGTERLDKWIAVKDNDVWKIEKRSSSKSLSLIEMYPLKKVMVQHFADIMMELNNDSIVVEYSGSQIQNLKKPFNIFITARGNPAYLKQVLSLSSEFLSHVAWEQQLDAWPNPLIVKIQNACYNDYYVKNPQLKIGIRNVNETPHL